MPAASTATCAAALEEDVLLIPVPGHTRGSMALLWRDVLFTGDHLWAAPDGRLSASPPAGADVTGQQTALALPQ